MGTAEWIVIVFCVVCWVALTAYVRSRIIRHKLNLDPKKTIRNVRWPE